MTTQATPEHVHLRVTNKLTHIMQHLAEDLSMKKENVSNFFNLQPTFSGTSFTHSQKNSREERETVIKISRWDGQVAQFN